MSPDEVFLEQLLLALAEAKLEALLVGSVAGVLHGAPVMTRDVDLLIRDTALNRKKLLTLAKALRAARPTPVSELSRTVTILGGALPVDVLFDELAGGLSFVRLRSRSVRVAIGAQTATVAALADIIASKEAAGRPKDLAQLPILRDTLRVKQALAESDGAPGEADSKE
jgi:hypothetical protein